MFAGSTVVVVIDWWGVEVAEPHTLGGHLVAHLQS